jgi:hypothetical protein
MRFQKGDVMKIKLGDRIQCIENKLPEFWWEFKIGSVYTVILKKDRLDSNCNLLSMKTENNKKGEDHFIYDISPFFSMYLDGTVVNNLGFKIVSRGYTREEIE